MTPRLDTARFALGLTALGLCLLTADLVVPVPAHAREPRVPQRVREKLQRDGKVRVIAELALPAPHVPEGELDSPAAVARQRQEIAATQVAALQRLKGRAHRVAHQFRTIPYLAVEVGPDALSELEAAGFHVVRIHEDRLSGVSLAQSVPLIEGAQAWNAGFDGAGTVVAVLDTGVDKNHPFVNKVVEEACFSGNGNCPNGLTTQLGPGAGAPCNFNPIHCPHGTHVAGIAAGQGATFSGVAPGAQIMAIQVFSRFDDFSSCAPSAPPCALSFDSDQMLGLERVYDLRKVYNFGSVNMSLGGGYNPTPCDSDPIKSIIDQLRAAGIATVIASGNNGFVSGISSPACVSTAVSVGATTESDAVASFSNSADFISLLAPGVSITSSVPGGGFETWAGTSMAAPHVAGAFAILKQAMPGASVDDMLAVLKGTGKHIRDPGNGLRKPRIALCKALSDQTTLQFGAAGYTVAEAAGYATLQVTRTGGCRALSTTVSYRTGNGTATAGSDYTAKTGTLTFAANVTTQNILVPITSDTIEEANETFTTLLFAPGSNLADSRPEYNGQYRGTCTGNNNFYGPESRDLAFTATNGAILVLQPGTTGSGLVNAAGVTEATVDGGICTLNGTLSQIGTAGVYQGSGTYSCSFPDSSSSSGTWNARQFKPHIASPATTTVTVTDNDEGGLIEFASAAFSVGEAGPTATITIRRTGGVASGVTVQYATSDGTATAGQDYTATSGTLSFAAGVTSRTFTVPIINDTLEEGDETINLTLSNPTSGAVLGAQSAAVLTILDNDAGGVLQFSAATYTAAEPVGPANGVVTITVTRTVPVGKTAASGVTVAYTTSDGSATAGQDYTATSGTLTFNAGVLSQTFTIPILHDTVVEGPETLNLALASPTGGATLGARSTAVLTITDNDVGGTIQFSSATYSVRENGGAATITVTRTGGAASSVTVQYATSDGTAIAGQDYTATSGTLTFGAGETTKTFTVPVLDDGLPEGNETVLLSLSNPGGGAVLGARSTATLTIADDEIALRFSAPTYTVSEAGLNATITVLRTGPTAPVVIVQYATSAGTATPGADYTEKTGTLTFGAGVTAVTFTVPIVNDTLEEGDETINLTLSNPTSGAVLGAQSAAVLTILDNDAGGVLQFSAATYTAAEPVGPANGVVTITVTRTVPVGKTAASGVTVAYTTSDGSATAGQDYTATSGTLTFNAGVLSQTFTIPILHDTVVEGPETLNLALASPTGGATLGARSTAVLTITD